MDENLDPATSILLCSENNSTCFDDDFECNVVADGSGISPFWDHTNLNSDHECPSILFQNDETLRVMFEREREHLPRDDYLKRLRSGDLDLSVRREALDWISKVGLIVFLKWGLLFFWIS